MSKEYKGGDKAFLETCKEREIAPTKRQYSHYVNGRGQARSVSKAGRPIDKFGTEQP